MKKSLFFLCIFLGFRAVSSSITETESDEFSKTFLQDLKNKNWVHGDHYGPYRTLISMDYPRLYEQACYVAQNFGWLIQEDDETNVEIIDSLSSVLFSGGIDEKPSGDVLNILKKIDIFPEYLEDALSIFRDTEKKEALKAKIFELIGDIDRKLEPHNKVSLVENEINEVCEEYHVDEVLKQRYLFFHNPKYMAQQKKYLEKKLKDISDSWDPLDKSDLSDATTSSDDSEGTTCGKKTVQFSKDCKKRVGYPLIPTSTKGPASELINQAWQVEFKRLRLGPK